MLDGLDEATVCTVCALAILLNLNAKAVPPEVVKYTSLSAERILAINTSFGESGVYLRMNQNGSRHPGPEQAHVLAKVSLLGMNYRSTVFFSFSGG